MDEEETIELSQSMKIAGAAVGVAALLGILIYIQHTMTKNREGRIVLPAGETYLGKSPTAAPQAVATVAPQAESPKFTPDPSEEWVTVRGNTYPYTFQAPESLSLVTFDNDPYDIYAIDWNDLSPSSNVLIGVDNLNNSETNKEYVNKPKKAYVENWWRQFGALKGVQKIDQFTNSQGLVGFRARFINQSGVAPFLDVFFEIPDRPELVIHMANGVLSDDTFDKIVDSVAWPNAQNAGTQSDTQDE